MDRLVATFQSLLEASNKLEEDAPDAEFLQRIIESELVRPAENDVLAHWFSRYLTIRHALWELIDECLKWGKMREHKLSDHQLWTYFIVGYSSACLLVRNDTKFLFEIAYHSVLQRKFNEAFAEYRIPRKQYTIIFAAFTDGRDALRIYDAIRVAKINRATLERLKDDPVVGQIARDLPEFETWLNPSKRTYLQRLLAYLSHKWRRKSVVSLNSLLSKSVENVGRAASEMKLPVKKRVPVVLREKMNETLQPGDIIITRHDTAFTNLFLPGFWPHAALYVGTVQQRDAMGVELTADTEKLWGDGDSVFEALKDGLHFRPITSTLAVDNFCVIRPNLSIEDIKQGIERVVRHQGKSYNFDFDFFSSDRLVCSEVVYRAFDGLGGLTFPLKERAGRHTLSPEDLLKFALSTDKLTVVGIFGVNDAQAEYISGERAAEIAHGSINMMD